ncbi:uncharacterized protein A4U43_C07F4300 [Asparagus officinalis]|uniref:BHLH domain-containing protein n=1 Tax=Asparagus officinalis TaxID=4686 RepID=A0A5P1E9D9_ASPOF|nr:transcription factor bHLH30-like [Asparagus officinalis]ONK62478.1 uncharacterized protein A4U43_C07F4300 [Asparagus officinalis]
MESGALALDTILMSGCENLPLLLPRPSNSGPPSVNKGVISWPSSSSPEIVRSKALKVHSQAEKRRRERINSHLSTLRRMVPDANNKMDKAALLARVIDHVKDLKTRTSNIDKTLSIPAEENEIAIELAKESENSATSTTGDFYMKASVSCDDRPDLFVSMMRAFHGLKLRTVGADITSLGGRAQVVFVLCGGDQYGSNVSLRSLTESLKDALGRIIEVDVGLTSVSSSKRQRLLQSYYSSVSI